MSSLFLRIFLPSAKGDYASPSVRAKAGALAGGVGICTNLLLAAGKFVMGAVSGSISITADAANNLTDAGSSLLTLAGFRLAAKPADKKHPFGHARYEYLTGLALSFLILLVGVSFLKESVTSFFSDSGTVIGNILLIILAASIAVKLWMWRFYRGIAALIDSGTLRAAATDSLSDSIMTAVVLAGALIRRFADVEIDGAVGCAVAAFIIFSGIRLVLETSSPLLGTAPDPTLVHRLKEMILAYPGIIGAHDLVIHSYGAGKVFATLHAEVDAHTDLSETHDLIDNIESEIGTALGLDLVIHMDPVTLDDPKLDAMHAEIETIIRQISPKLRHHDFRVVFGPTHDNILFDVVVPTGFPLPDSELIYLLDSSIKRVYPNAVPKVRVDHDYADFLEE
ncbi:MAG: cation transporter [Clostridia bacterium]|nr:cation transporter [Clostridia bacterium]